MKKIYIICESYKEVSYLNDIWEVFANKKIAEQRVNYLRNKYKDANFWVEEKKVEITWIWENTLKQFLEPAK